MPSQARQDTIKALSHVDFDLIDGPAKASYLGRKVKEIASLGGNIGIDTETTGLDPRRDQVRLVQVGTTDYALVVDLDGWRTPGQRQVPWDSYGLRELRQLLEGGTPKVLQNAAFDLNFLKGEGIDLGGPLFDTMIAAKLINNGTGAKNDLGSLVERNLKVPMPKELQKANWAGNLTREMLEYSARDAVCLPLLERVLGKKLKESKVAPGVTLEDLFSLEMSVLRPVALMQWYGFEFDVNGARELHTELLAQSEELKAEFLEHLDQEIKRRNPDKPEVWLPRDEDGSVNTREKDTGSIRLGTKLLKGFNPRSVPQMAERFAQAGIILAPNDKGAPSLDQNLLAFLRKDYALVDEYLTWKTSVTRVSDVEKLLESIGPDGRIHAGYRQMGTDTGRLSCAGPNLQQVNRSKEFRSKFIAAAGYVLVVADFSQVELRVAAFLAQEDRMIEAYRAGRDLHTETASLITKVPQDQVTKEARTSAKLANFGLLYGAGPATLRKQAVAQYGLDMPKDEAEEIVEGFRLAYPALYKWQVLEGNKETESVFTAIGRKRRLIGFNAKYTTRINTQVQGTAGDIAKIAIKRLWTHLRQVPEAQARLIAMVHDEIVLEVREDLAEHWGAVLKESMESAGAEVCTNVPIVAEVSYGKTWAGAK